MEQPAKSNTPQDLNEKLSYAILLIKESIEVSQPIFSSEIEEIIKTLTRETYHIRLEQEETKYKMKGYASTLKALIDELRRMENKLYPEKYVKFADEICKFVKTLHYIINEPAYNESIIHLSLLKETFKTCRIIKDITANNETIINMLEGKDFYKVWEEVREILDFYFLIFYAKITL